jgi:hypothetical protein
MSVIDDPWPRSSPPAPSAPPRPDVNVSEPSTNVPVPLANAFEGAETWKRVGAILGIVWAFFFLLTIPGWLALAHYKKWKRGEINTPYGLIWWGYGFSALILIAMLASSGS